MFSHTRLISCLQNVTFTMASNCIAVTPIIIQKLFSLFGPTIYDAVNLCPVNDDQFKISNGVNEYRHPETPQPQRTDINARLNGS